MDYLPTTDCIQIMDGLLHSHAITPPVFFSNHPLIQYNPL
jgi:hypothetical protein